LWVGHMQKIRKLINQASSDEPAEAQQASKMAAAFMVREGVSFADLLKHKEKLYIDGLMLTARAYSKRTTKTQPEAQKVSAQLYRQINEAYHPSPKVEYKASSVTNNQEKARLQWEREELDRKAQELRQKEADILRRGQLKKENVIYTKGREHEYQPQQTKRSHNINIANHFLKMLVLHPILTLRLFVRSLIQALIVSAFIMLLVVLLRIFFGMDLTFNLTFLAMYEGLVFILLIAYTLVNIRGWYPSE